MTSEMNALITGASSGIGRAIAIAIASVGGAVCLVGRNRERLHATARVARSAARSVSVIRADLSADSGLEAVALHVKRKFSAIDVLIHSAGMHAIGPVEQMSVVRLDELYRINLRAPYVLTQALLPYLKPRRGQVVFVNSSQGLRTAANTVCYAAVKHGLKAMADGIRQEVNADGVRVLSVYPGRTATPAIRKLYDAPPESYEPSLLQPEDVANAILNALQLPRTAEVTDIQIRPLIRSY